MREGRRKNRGMVECEDLRLIDCLKGRVMAVGLLILLSIVSEKLFDEHSRWCPLVGFVELGVVEVLCLLEGMILLIECRNVKRK